MVETADKLKEVWIVDDSPALSAVLRAKTKNIKDLPYKIIAIETPNVAISRMGAERPALIISDYNILGDGDGVTVVQAANNNKIPAVMVSGDANVKEEADKHGVVFFEKSKDGSHIGALINHINTTLGYTPFEQQATSVPSR